MDAQTHHPKAPTRLMALFLEQKEKLLAALSDHGGLFECRFLARLVRREQAAVGAATAEAGQIDDQVAAIRRQFLHDISAASRSPGVIDRKEAEKLFGSLVQLAQDTRSHAAQLRQLN